MKFHARSSFLYTVEKLFIRLDILAERGVTTFQFDNVVKCAYSLPNNNLLFDRISNLFNLDRNLSRNFFPLEPRVHATWPIARLVKRPILSFHFFQCCIAKPWTIYIWYSILYFIMYSIFQLIHSAVCACASHDSTALDVNIATFIRCVLLTFGVHDSPGADVYRMTNRREENN